VPPRTTAIGALSYYVSHADATHYQPTNITFGIMAPLDETPGRRPKKGAERKLAVSARALEHLDAWLGQAVAGGTSDEAIPVGRS
jgi:methylenetetrahydrofolate--tRNA-(uracil-5-)-methyltransferase